ncbi:MAG TPA: hypothetical protein DCQ06_13135 [Myxococcales bacterium]|nr:hypothetical protein [Myxococcales bacterium]HAN32533.1 hypothetical protein [Myxococcales bacterium]
MAHRILGIDVGQRFVKCAVIERSLRSSALIDFQREAVQEPYDKAAQTQALERLLNRVRKSDDVIETGLPASTCMHRTLNFPFKDTKSLQEAAGFELESHIPIDLDEVIVDFVVAEERRQGEYDVLTVAAPHQVVSEHIDLFRAANAEPRTLTLTPLAHAAMLQQLPEHRDVKTLVLDIGASGTEVLLAAQGNALAMRSLSIGSADIRERFVEQFDVDSPGGDLLASHGVLLTQGATPRNEDEKLLNEATQSAIMPWLREVRQTLAYVSRGGRGRPEKLLLTGGMSRLRGLVGFVEQALQIRTSTITLDELPNHQLFDPEILDAAGDFGASAVALALLGTDARGEQQMNFRQGDLAYEGDFKFLRARLPAIAAFALVALCLVGVRSTITYRALVSEKERQVSQLRSLSKEMTGKPISSFTKLNRELKRPVTVDLAAYYPDITAIRTFNDISKIIARVTEPPEFKPGGPANAQLPGIRLAQVVPKNFRGAPKLGSLAVRARIPAGGARVPPKPSPAAATKEPSKEGFFGHKVELTNVDIDRSKVSMRGDCDTQDALLALQQAINKHRCFGKIKSSSDKITFQRHKGWFRFNLSFEVRCPQSQNAALKSSEKEGKGKSSKRKGDAKSK